MRHRHNMKNLKKMKQTIFLLLFATTINKIYSQRIAIDEVDKFTDNIVYKVDVSKGRTWKNSDKITEGLFNNIFLSTKLIYNDKESLILTNFNVQIGADVCINPKDGKIIILFTDHSKLILNQTSDVKCDNNLDIEYLLGKDESLIRENLKILSTKEMDSFRIYFSDGYKDFVIRDNKRELIANHYKLIEERLIQ